MRSRTAILSLVILCCMASPRPLVAQKHAIADRSLAASLLGAAVPLPLSPLHGWDGAGDPTSRVRFELQFSRSAATAAMPLLIVGLRSDHPWSDVSAPGFGVVGVRMGFETEDRRAGSRLPAAVEFQAGTRISALRLDSTSPEVGLDVVAGWSGLEEETRGTLGVRLPVEYAWEMGRSRVLLSGVPTMAWGHVRFRECENLGYGDGCGDLGIQLEFGRTRFLMAGGVTLNLVPAGLALSVGTQHMLAIGQRPRLAMGLTWAP